MYMAALFGRPAVRHRSGWKGSSAGLEGGFGFGAEVVIRRLCTGVYVCTPVCPYVCMYVNLVDV